jgi:DNA-binding NtrC family response regulator
LRERAGDAVLLARRFLQRLSRQYHKPEKELHPDTIGFLDNHRWPGNVRELENLIQRAFLLSDAPLIHLGPTAGQSRSQFPDGPSAIKQLTATAFKQAKARAIAEFERAYIVELLARTDGNISLAARVSGKERSRLGKLVRKYGLERQAFVRYS